VSNATCNFGDMRLDIVPGAPHYTYPTV